MSDPTSGPKIDDRYTEGAWFDGTVGQFYTFNRVDDGTSIELRDPLTGERVDTLGAAEFFDIQHELYRVPDDSLNDPVAYLEDCLARLGSNEMTMDVGCRWAEYATKIVEKDGEN